MDSSFRQGLGLRCASDALPSMRRHHRTSICLNLQYDKQSSSVGSAGHGSSLRMAFQAPPSRRSVKATRDIYLKPVSEDRTWCERSDRLTWWLSCTTRYYYNPERHESCGAVSGIDTSLWNPNCWLYHEESAVLIDQLPGSSTKLISNF